MTEQEAHSILVTAMDRAGGVSPWAKQQGISAAYAYDLKAGKRPMSDRIAAAIGLERTIVRTVEYREKEQNHA
jgi:hypothetical protein